MSASNDQPVIKLLILVYDRTANHRFPFKRKWYRFNSQRAESAEVETVLRLFGGQQRNAAPLAIGEASVSMSLGGDVCTISEFLKYRYLFDFVPEGADESDDLVGDSEFYISTSAPNDYYEDENEKPITLIEIFDEEAKRDGNEGSITILYGHPESILRLSPAVPIRAGLWTSEDADLVTHLENTHHQLIHSRWLQSKCVVSPIMPGQYKAILPVKEDCMSVILPFRQLYSKDGSDDLFNCVCNLHKRHCPKNHPTYDWVIHYQKQFNVFLESPQTNPFCQTTLTAKRYLDAFAYGARLVHAKSNNSDPAVDLTELLKRRPREKVVLGYHFILRQLLECVSQALQIIVQNVNHWINDHGWPSSTTEHGGDIFESR